MECVKKCVHNCKYNDLIEGCVKPPQLACPAVLAGDASNTPQTIIEEVGMRVHILGSRWTVKQRSESEDENLKDCDGYCDWTTREIVVEREESGTLADMERYIRKVIRHEIIHAFLFESGLCQCTGSVENWAMNEEMVDWLAHQGQQIYAAWKEAGALDEQ